MNDMNNELEFREHIKVMSDRELSEFTALQVYDFGGRLLRVEKFVNKRNAAILGGGGGAGFVALIIYLIEHFVAG